MAASKHLTPEQRTIRARLAAHKSWANTKDRTARTAPGRRAGTGSVDYWLDRVDPEGVMSPEGRRKAATSARNAHMASLSFKNSKARQAKAEGGATSAA